ncbi:hypothetical protein PLANPX_0131 [Lacipirellula parvula]|uniref:Uncharacterized protein n=1 Tax=Lacipirellula parvula TaxID=2650471 RepID=A0A5K7XBQ0_9BACT|nr:hypothetical protein PLANPX_0131 [Lacipirellula parvula]
MQDAWASVLRNRWAWLREADFSVRDSGSVAGKSDNAEPISAAPAQRTCRTGPRFLLAMGR